MKTSRYLYPLIALAIISFTLSYFGSGLGHLNEGDAVYPYSLVKRYSEQGESWINVSNHASFKAHEAESIEVQTGSTEIRVESSPGLEVEVSLEGKYLPRSNDSGEILKTDLKNGVLTIKTDEDKRSQNFKYNESLNRGTLTIHIPPGIRRLSLKSLSGRISASGLKPDSLAVDTQSGEIDFGQIHSEEVNLKTMSGEVSFSGYFDRLTGETQSGDIQVTSENSVSKIKLISTSSDIEVYYQKKPSARLDFQTKSGSIRIEGIRSDFESTGPYATVWGTGTGELQVHTVSGNLSAALDD